MRKIFLLVLLVFLIQTISFAANTVSKLHFTKINISVPSYQPIPNDFYFADGSNFYFADGSNFIFAN